MTPLLELRNVSVSSVSSEESIPILHDVSLQIFPNEVHALMGPNGSGKTTLAQGLMGHPSLKITNGEILFRGEVINDWSTDQRAKAGMFLAFQHPASVPGVTSMDILKTAKNLLSPKTAPRRRRITSRDIEKELQQTLSHLHVSSKILKRPLDSGLSGGEKKKAEMLHAAALSPLLYIFDEIDSGLDIDAVRRVAHMIHNFCKPETAVLLITHYERLLSEVSPTHVHVFQKGRLIQSGNAELATKIMTTGFHPQP